MRSKYLILILFLLALGVSSCGKKGNPVAPGETAPAPVSDLQAFGKADGIFLRWSIPSRNLDNTRLEDLMGFQVFRHERSLDPSCPDCPLRFESVGEIDVEFPRGPVQIQGNQVTWRDTNIRSQRQYVYLVRGYNFYTTPSPESNQVKVSWDEPPAAPQDVRILRSENQALEIGWSYTPLLASGKEMKDLAGFNIYRRTEGQNFTFLPLNLQPVIGNSHLDSALENGRLYSYQVRAVRNLNGTLIEGRGSPIVSGIPEKRTVPSPPVGLVAGRQPEGVALRWTPNPEPDVTGYNIYRREPWEKDFQKINPQLVAGSYFLDPSAEPGKSYEYSLKAVDSTGKESDFSQPVEVGPEGK